MQAMTRIYPYLTSTGAVRHLRISLPLVECLIDNQRYFLPSDLAEPRGDELRPLYRPRLGNQPGRSEKEDPAGISGASSCIAFRGNDLPK
jgi:hypothetical protein